MGGLSYKRDACFGRQHLAVGILRARALGEYAENLALFDKADSIVERTLVARSAAYRERIQVAQHPRSELIEIEQLELRHVVDLADSRCGNETGIV